MREDGYLPIRDYGAIGDGRTAALVRATVRSTGCACPISTRQASSRASSTERGGHFALEPEAPYEVTRQYVPGTNVLETTFTTADGARASPMR